MSKKDIIVIGASSGGVQALSKIVSFFPADFSASVFIVQHIPSHIKSYLHTILSAKGPLPAVQPENSQKIVTGTIYVAPPNRHLLVNPDDHMELAFGPRENRVRPSIDALFRSAAASYTTRVVAVLLTGYLDDGVSGLFAVKRCGGTTVVQDPAEAEVPDMPRTAIEKVEIDHVLSLEDIAFKVIELSKQTAGAPPEVPEDIMMEIKVSQHKVPDIEEMKKIGESTSFTCPECGGVLFRMKEEPIMRYVCHTGHSFTHNSLLAGQSEVIEYSLWSAIKHLQERSKIFRNMAENERKKEREKTAEGYSQLADEIEYHARIIRDFVVSGKLSNNKSGLDDESLRNKTKVDPETNMSDTLLKD